MKDITQRIRRSRRFWIGLTAILSLRFAVSWEYVVSYGSGSRISQVCKAPGDLNQEGGGFCLGPRTESFHGGFEAGDHYSPMPSANRLSFPPMCYPGSS